MRSDGALEDKRLIETMGRDYGRSRPGVTLGPITTKNEVFLPYRAEYFDDVNPGLHPTAV